MATEEGQMQEVAERCPDVATCPLTWRCTGYRVKHQWQMVPAEDPESDPKCTGGVVRQRAEKEV